MTSVATNVALLYFNYNFFKCFIPKINVDTVPQKQQSNVVKMCRIKLHDVIYDLFIFEFYAEYSVD